MTKANQKKAVAKDHVLSNYVKGRISFETYARQKGVKYRSQIK